MSRIPRLDLRRPHARRLAAMTAAVAALAGLSACGPNFGAQTNQQYQAAAGANYREGDVQVLGAVLVANEDGSGTVSAALLNTTHSVEQLTSITATTLDGKRLKTTVANGPARLDLPVDLAVQVGAHKSLVAFVDGIEAGGYATLTLEFSDSPSVTLNVPIVTRTSEYDNIARPAAAKTPEATDTVE